MRNRSFTRKMEIEGQKYIKESVAIGLLTKFAPVISRIIKYNNKGDIMSSREYIFVDTGAKVCEVSMKLKTWEILAKFNIVNPLHTVQVKG